MEKRVVVTGIGVVSPVGNNVDAMWESIKAGRHGIAEITRFDLEGHKVTLAAEVKEIRHRRSVCAGSCQGGCC